MEDLLESLRHHVRYLSGSPSCSDGPWREDRLQQLAETYRPRHLPDEIVKFYRLGPVAPFALTERPTPLTTAEDDLFWLKRRGDFDKPAREGPLSSRWIPLASHDRSCALAATNPQSSPYATIILWDPVPDSPQPMFPTLRSFLWFLNAVAERLRSGEIVDERDFEDGWFRDLVYPDRALVPDYEVLYEAAVSAAPTHSGWVADQPLPRDGGWTLEWARALGVADLDLVDS